MKSYLILFLTLFALSTYAQTSIKAVTDEPANLILPKATRKAPVPIKIGDSITLHSYSEATGLWQATYKGFRGTLIDSLLERSNKVTLFKNIFIDRDLN